MATFTGADKAIAFLFDVAKNIADDYDSTSTYAQGEYTIYAGTLYKCISAVSSAENFDPTKWDAVLIMDEVAAGGGGGGTTVIANPSGTATDTLNKLQVGPTIYDVPSGGGSSGHTWSRTEHPVGVWVDGKTVYEKTIKYEFNSSSGTRTIQIPHDVSGMETVVAFFGVMNHTTVIPYGETFPSKDAEFRRCSVKSTYIEISVSGSWDGYVLELTIQYTKI